jgi:hypothetical protein
VDLSKLTTSDKVIAGSAIALLIFSFTPWYGKYGGSRNGWDYFLFGIIPVLLGIAMAVIVFLQRMSDTKLPDLPITWAQAMMAAGGLAALLILLKLLIGDDISGFGGSLDLDRKYGIFLSFLSAVGLAVGGFLKTKEPEGTTAL